MDKLINISDQNFYHLSVGDFLETDFQFDKCAIIIDEKLVAKALLNQSNWASENVNHIIIMGEKLNAVLPSFINQDSLISLAADFREAILFSAASSNMNENIVCVTDEKGDDIIEEITSNIG